MNWRLHKFDDGPGNPSVKGSKCLFWRWGVQQKFCPGNFLSWKIIFWGVQQKLFLFPKHHHQGGGGGEEGDGELRMGERMVLTNCQREERFICLFVCLFVARSADEEEADTSAQRTAKHNLRYSIPLSAAQWVAFIKLPNERHYQLLA